MPRASLARFPAPFSSVLPGLFVAGDDTHETHSFAPGVAQPAPVDVDEDDLPDLGGHLPNAVDLCRCLDAEEVEKRRR